MSTRARHQALCPAQRFGWVLDKLLNGRWAMRGGSLDEALFRFAWFEACFASGIEFDRLGSNASFLQPYNYLWDASLVMTSWRNG